MSKMTGRMTGRCLCGAVTWECDGPVLWAGHCHCDSCRRATSSPFTSFFGVARGICASCGTRLYFRSEKFPDEIHVHTATLDDPGAYVPDAEVWTGNRLDWLSLKTGLPKHDGFQNNPRETT